jgi:uncharacterized protein (TIGR04255 family)
MNNIELSNNPINTCLIQIKFSPLLIIEESIIKLQEAFRNEGFTEFKKVEVNNYNISEEPDIPQVSKKNKWLFYTNDEQRIIILDTTQISYQVSTYSNFTSFIKLFKNILEKFSKIIKFTNNTLINRIGLRYVNCFEGEDNFNKYLKAEYQGIKLSPEFHKIDKAIINTTYRCPLLIDDKKISNLLLRVYQNGIGVKVPLNIYSLKENIQKEKKLITFLDIDQSLLFENYSLTSLEEIYKFAKNLNDFSTKIFLDAITEEAKEDWK